MINFDILLFLTLFIVCILVLTLLKNKSGENNLRDIPAFYRLKGAIELSVEDGTRIHVAIGRSGITSPQGAAAMIGLSMLKRVGNIASESDEPPIATIGEGTIMVLAQDTIRNNYAELGLSSSYSNDLGRMSGITPFSYAAGTMSLIFDEDVSTNLLVGSFGPESALMTSAGERSQTLTIAGTDNIPGQAVLFATAHEPLIGEELYAGGAYLGAGPVHIASLHSQDILRWIIVGLLVTGAVSGLISGLTS